MLVALTVITVPLSTTRALAAASNTSLKPPTALPTNTPVPPTSPRTAGVVPVELSLSNSQACAALGYAHEYKVDPPRSGTYHLADGDHTVTATIDAKTIYVSWTARIGIDAVVVKGGRTANVYQYNPEARGDRQLHSPVNASGQFAQISHVSFCYDYDQASPPTATATNTPVPPTATATNTPVPPTATATNTPVPPTATATNTPVPPTATATNTPVPPTSTPVSTGSNLSGIIWSDGNDSWTREPDEPGLSGVLVELYRDNGDGSLGPEDTFVTSTTTDPDGNYTFPGLSEGSYLILVLAECPALGGPIALDGQQPGVIDVGISLYCYS